MLTSIALSQRGVRKVNRMPQELDIEHWRPITFEGTEFPASLMGIDIMFSENGISDGAAEWLAKLSTCRGFEKSSPAEVCCCSSRNVIDFIEGDPQAVIDRIQSNLAEHGFDPQITLSEWSDSLKRIETISANTTGNCSWIAPSHESAVIKTKEDAQKLMDAIDKGIIVDE